MADKKDNGAELTKAAPVGITDNRIDPVAMV